MCRTNILGDVIAIYNTEGDLQCKYNYDAWGNHRIGNARNELIYDSATGVIATGYENHIAIQNPIRYRGYYYDTETQLFYCNSRYYSPEICRFISPDSIEYLDPQSIDGLNLYAYCGNDPVNKYDPSGNFAISTFLIGLAVTSLVSWGLSKIFGAQIAGGIGSIASGGTAISTGISLMAFGPWGIVAGIALMAVGTATAVFGTNEIAAGITGTNYIQSWSGMSDGLYNGLNIGLNIASSIGSIASNLGMKCASNRILNNIIQNPSQITNYKLWQIKTYGRYTTQWSVGTLNKGNAAGKGYVLRQTYDGRYIQCHPAGSTWHINQNPYWKISSGTLGKMWFDYITGLRFYP